MLGVDEVGAVVVGQLVLVGHRERPGRAGLDAQAAEDAAQVVDLVDAAVALPGAEPLVLGVGRTLDVDRVGRAGPGAQLAADALLEAVGPAVELVPAVEPRCRRHLLEGVLLGDHLLEHGPEGDPEPGDRVPELFLERGHGQSSSAAGGHGVRLVSKVSGCAAPRTAPPVGIGGVGNRPARRAGRGRLGVLVLVVSARPEEESRAAGPATPIPIRRYWRSMPPSSETARIVATATIQISALGISPSTPAP